MNATKNPVIFEAEENIAYITLNRPERKNAINAELMQNLNKYIEQIENESSIHCVVIQGNKDAFSSGIDLNYAAGILGEDGKVNMDVFHQNVALLQGTIEKIALLKKPTIASISGHCAGLGLELALGTDIRIASNNAVFALPEIVLSLVADCGGTSRAMKIIGEAHAKWMLMTGEYISAQRAYEIGLISKLVDIQNIDSEIKSIAKKLANRNMEVIRQIKRLARFSHIKTIPDMLKLEIEAQESVISRDDFAEYLMKGFAELSSRKKER